MSARHVTRSEAIATARDVSPHVTDRVTCDLRHDHPMLWIVTFHNRAGVAVSRVTVAYHYAEEDYE